MSKQCKFIKSVKLLNTAGAYWRGDEYNKQLTRIYGISFPKEKLLKEYLQLIEEAKKRDHRVLGKKLGENWDLKVSSVLEIFEAVSANISKSESVFSDLGKFCTHFIVFVDGKLLPPHLINSKILIF